jgi:hypothetical protein
MCQKCQLRIQMATHRAGGKVSKISGAAAEERDKAKMSCRLERMASQTTLSCTAIETAVRREMLRV